MSFELTRHDVDRLRKILQNLLEQTEGDSCLVCNEAGHVLLHANLGRQDPLLISALGAGVFAATRELARLLGEDEFSSVLHQGQKRSILIAAADDNLLLVVLFSGEQKVGLVKLYTPAAAGSVRAVIKKARQRSASPKARRRKYELQDDGDIFGITAKK